MNTMDKSGVRAMKWVKREIPSFGGKMTSWRRFKMEFLMATRLFRLDSMLAGDKEESPVADRTFSRYRLHARYFNSKVVNHFVVWSLIPSSLKTDIDKRVFLSTKLPVAGWDRVGIFHHAETQDAMLLLSRQVLSARLQPDQDPAIFIGEIEKLFAALDDVGSVSPKVTVSCS